MYYVVVVHIFNAPVAAIGRQSLRGAFLREKTNLCSSQVSLKNLVVDCCSAGLWYRGIPVPRYFSTEFTVTENFSTAHPYITQEILMSLEVET